MFTLASMLRCYCAVESWRTGYVHYGGPKGTKRNESLSDKIVHISTIMLFNTFRSSVEHKEMEAEWQSRSPLIILILNIIPKISLKTSE